jgi:hypothetical protein
MLSGDALRGVALRRVAAPTKAAGPGDGVAQEAAQNARLRAVDIEAWYEALKDVTFRTEFVELSIEEARALVETYWTWKRSGADDGPLPPLLEALEKRVAAAMEALESPCGVFVKLSSRSPKDSRLCQGRALGLVQERLRARRAAGLTVDENDVTIAIMAASMEALRLESARAVLVCLLTSDRVCEDDLPLALSFPARWSQHLCLREWVTIAPSAELRAFVVGGRLTALTQYYVPVHFAELALQRARVVELVEALFASLAPRCPVHPPEYSMDVAVDVAGGRARVVELNPFGKPDGLGTGTVLFDVRVPHDAAVLFGEAPFEFRIQEQPLAAPPRVGPLRDWLEKEGFPH